MTTHLTMEQLLACRTPQSEPGLAAAEAHLAACAHCTQELARLEQRVARLRALPPLRPARDQWPAVQRLVAAERRSRLVRRTAWASLAAAAGVAFVVLARSGALARQPEVAAAVATEEVGSLAVMKSRSQLLEAALESYNPQMRVLDGRTAVLADALQERIAHLDRQLQAAQLEGPERGFEARDARLLQLWEERVGLLDALVDVRVTRASNIGL